MRTSVLLLPSLLLLLLPAPTALADATQSTHDGARDGFTTDGDRLLGDRVHAETTESGLGAVTLDGTPLLAAVSVPWPGTWSVDGPLATRAGDDGALHLHDNRFGWLTVRGEPGTVTLTGTTAWTVADDGASATAGAVRVFLERTGTLAADGEHLSASFDGPTGLAVATEPGVFGHALRAGAWAVVHVDGDDPASATADWLNVHGAPFRLTDAGEETLAFDLVGTLGDGAPDLLVRFDLHGFPTTGGLALRMADLVARAAPADAVLGDARGPFSFHAEPTGDGWTVLLRLPAGLSGHLVLTHDDQPAAVTVTTRDLDPWAPQQAIPTLLAMADEPGVATLVVGEDYEKRTVVRAYEHTFRLVGLQPATTYPYHLRFTDLAGNEATVEGSFTTGNATVGSRHIEADAQRLADGAWRITANVTDVTGAPVPSGVAFFVDKQAAMPRFQDGVWSVVLDGVAPGEHEVAVEATGPDGRVREVLTVTVDATDAGPEADASGPVAMVLLAVFCAAVLGRRASLP